MNYRAIIIGSVVCLALASVAQAQPRMPNKQEIAAFKKLATQSVSHIEASLKKIQAAGPTVNAAVVRVEIEEPANALLAEWKSFGLSDQVMMEYSGCTGALSELAPYGAEARRAPRFLQSDVAQQKLRFIREDLAACRVLIKQAPSFS